MWVCLPYMMMEKNTLCGLLIYLLRVSLILQSTMLVSQYVIDFWYWSYFCNMRSVSQLKITMHSIGPYNSIFQFRTHSTKFSIALPIQWHCFDFTLVWIGMWKILLKSYGDMHRNDTTGEIESNRINHYRMIIKSVRLIGLFFFSSSNDFQNFCPHLLCVLWAFKLKIIFLFMFPNRANIHLGWNKKPLWKIWTRNDWDWVEWNTHTATEIEM